MPLEQLLADYPEWIRDSCETLRAIVRTAVPDSVERVRTGWRLIGYDVPVGRRLRYFAFVWPEPEHAHIGFEHGIFLADPERMLEGAHLKLRKVRYMTFRPGQAIPDEALIAFTREAAGLAAMTREQRLAMTLMTDTLPGLS